VVQFLYDTSEFLLLQTCAFGSSDLECCLAEFGVLTDLHGAFALVNGPVLVLSHDLCGHSESLNNTGVDRVPKACDFEFDL